MKMKEKHSCSVTVGSGNVFRDLGLPHAEESHQQVHRAVWMNRFSSLTKKLRRSKNKQRQKQLKVELAEMVFGKDFPKPSIPMRKLKLKTMQW